jgi:hypothetical protein
MKVVIFFLVCSLFPLVLNAQDDANYDEDKVPLYTLPDPLHFTNGGKVRTAKAWMKKRRPQLLEIFEDQVYGKIPAGLKMTSFRLVEESATTPYRNGHRKQVEMLLSKDGKELPVQLLIYLPDSREKVPLFLGYNFHGNHSVNRDSEVRITTSWCRDNPSLGIINNQLTEQSRGVEEERWPIQMILDAGYGIATMYYGDVDPDRDDFSDGVHPFAYAEGQTLPARNGWGAISAWAWGLSRAMDYLETDSVADASKVIVFGHSRLGKTALWAGATDTRFAIVVSNNSGCGGAALSRRRFGETVKRINTSFPHWFCANFKAYNNNENMLPVDQHELIALIAPRPVYIASAELDKWADPKGEYLAGYHASPVYGLFEKTGLESPDQPPVNQPVMNQIGYHIRTGRHNITPYDWEQYIEFADLHLRGCRK